MKINRENGKWLLIAGDKTIKTETFKECWAAMVREFAILLEGCGAILTADREYISLPGEGLVKVETYMRRAYAESNK